MSTNGGLLVAVPELLMRAGVDEDDLSEVDFRRAEAAITDASALVRDEARQAWSTPEATPEAVRTVVLESARRVFVNPERNRSETAGPFSATRDAVGAYLTAEEKAIVQRYRRLSRGPAGLWTLPTSRGDHGCTEFAADQFGGDWIPYYTPPER